MTYLARIMWTATGLLSFSVLGFGSIGPAIQPHSQLQLSPDFHLLPGPQAAATMPTTVLDRDPSAVRLLFSDPPLQLDEIVLDGQTYVATRLPGEGSTLEDGLPDLPRVTRLVMIPNTGNVALTITSQSYTVQSLDAPPSPRQPLAADEEATAFATVPPDAQVYAADSWFPPVIAEITSPATLRDVRFVVLVISPVQVNPATGEMRVYDLIEVAIEAAGGIGENEITVVPTSVAASFRPLYAQFVNFPGSPLDELPVVPGKQLIICPNDAGAITEVQSLVEWRRRRGLDASFVTTAVAGGTAAAIQAYIQSQYNASNGDLEFVTIVGDPDATAPYNLPTHSSQLDNYYGTVGIGNPDPLPDLSVGRLPVRTLAELNAVVAKTIQYEADPYVADTTWFTRAWCAAHTNFVASNPSMKQYTRQIMLQHGMSTVNFDIFSSAINPTTLNNRINQGVTVFNHRMSWIGEMSSSDLSGIANGRKLPFVMSVTCATGTFFGSSALSEDWVRRGSAANPSGAIGCVGMSGTGTHVPYNNIVDAGTMWGFYVLGIREQGTALLAGKVELYKNYAAVGHMSDVQNFCYWTNLQGDPAVPIWLSVPRAATVTRPLAVHRYTDNVTVSVQRAGQPVQDALVGLLKGSETFSRGYTGTDGTINLPVALPTNGYLYVTVTKSGLDTYVDSIQVITPAASLSFHSNTVDDDNLNGTSGDGNAILNPGETVDLNLRLSNTGTSSPVNGIIGTLSTSHPGVQIVSGVQSYPNLVVGANALPNAPFRVQIGAVFNGEPVSFFLNTSSSVGAQVIRMDLTPVAGDVSFVSSSFPDANSRLDPGETGSFTVTFTNSGGRVLTNATARLRSLDSHVTVNDSIGTYGNVPAGANGSNGGDPFNVTATIQTVGGYRVPMQLVVIDAAGFRDSTTFMQTVGVATSTTPTGPDDYGYYAYDNTETAPPGCASVYSWFEIAPGLGGPGTSLGFTDGAEDGDQVAVRTLPFNFQFYGQSFNQVTICTNGWLAFGEQSIIDFRNYHIGSPIGPANQIAAYWDDLIVTGITNGGVFTYNDAASGRYIVEWRTRTLWSGVNEVFQVILFDPATYPSPTGDGKILVQYQTVTMSPNSGSNDNDYATLGIQNADHSIGLEYSYWNTYSPGAATMANGRAIMYTTDNVGSVPMNLSLVSPNGGEAWLRDSTVTIAWVGGTAGSNVLIQLSRNGTTGPWTTLSASTPNDGAFPWTVTGPNSDACRIRIAEIGNPSQADTSAGDFLIGAVQVVFAEDFEDLAPDWTHAPSGGTWVDNWHVSTERAFSGIRSYKCGDTGTGDYSDLNDALLVSPVITNLPANATLTFQHQIVSELSGLYADSCYDGGLLEISANGGAFNQISPASGYPRHFRYRTSGSRPYSGPLPGAACWADTAQIWSNVLVDLSPFSGQNIRLRWRFCSDSAGTREGWYVDDVSIFAPTTGGAPEVPVNLTLYQSGGNLVLRWAPDGNTHYRIYSGPTSDNATEMLEGSTTANQFVISGGASATKRFYVVVGWDGN